MECRWKRFLIQKFIFHVPDRFHLFCWLRTLHGSRPWIKAAQKSWKSTYGTAFIHDFKIYGIRGHLVFVASSRALPALKVAIDDECSGKGLAFTKNNPPDFGLLFLAQFARFSIRTESEVTVHAHSQTNRHLHLCLAQSGLWKFGFVGPLASNARSAGSISDQANGPPVSQWANCECRAWCSL